VRVDVDPQRLEQVLTNLISNAGKYSEPGSDIIVEVAASAAEARISVTNVGPGISPAEQAHLFERFYRAPRAGGRSGLGLGLYIVHGLVVAHGGRIWVESEPGRATTFR